jgi:hypothetical protein
VFATKSTPSSPKLSAKYLPPIYHWVCPTHFGKSYPKIVNAASDSFTVAYHEELKWESDQDYLGDAETRCCARIVENLAEHEVLRNGAASFVIYPCQSINQWESYADAV